MITAVHTLLYSDDPEATRAFFRDVLEMPFVRAEPDSDWLIFRTGPSELGVHPAVGIAGGEQHSASPHHEVSLVCDDVEATVADLAAKGAELAGGIEDRGFGLVAMLRVPGAGEMVLYQPRHAEAHSI